MFLKDPEMKTDSVKQNQSPELETYKTTVGGIEFLEKHLQDPDILSSNSNKSKLFLMQSFSYLHPDFHYLSFLSPDDLDTEIIKAARILQILPINSPNKLSDVFQNDVKKFWDKFFSLFENKKQIDSRVDSIFALGWENKVSFFKDMKGTMNYLNYEFPVLNSKKLSNSDINKEINNWKELTPQIDINNDKSTSFNCDEEEIINTDIVKITDLKQIASMYFNIKLIKKQNEPEHLDFFHNFIFLTKNILEYKKNISTINSTALDGFYGKLLLNDVNFLENLCFIKRCLKFMKTLKSKHL